MKKIIALLCFIICLTSSVASETKPNTVYFDDQALNPILSMIDQAQSSIYIQMYNFTNTHDKDLQNSEVIQCLLNKLTENPENRIDLKIIIDGQEGANCPPEQNGKPTGFPESTFEAIAPDCIRWDIKSGKMHRKVAVVDESEIFIGSTNWTKSGFSSNREIDVLLHDPEIASQIRTQFDEDWEVASQDFPSKDKHPETPAPPETEDHYVGNSNSMKFHRPSCKYIDNIDEDHKVIFATKQEAIENQYVPCGACKP